MLISLLLPTIRPDLFRIRMNEYACLKLPGPCEVVVVSDHSNLDITPTHPEMSIRLFMQDRMGTVAACNLAFAESRGRYVMAMNDEFEIHQSMLAELFAAGEAHGEDGILTPMSTPYCSNDYYGVYFATYPFGRRSYFQKLNGADVLFDPVYRCFYADPDLSMRSHFAGHPVVVVRTASGAHHCVYEAVGHAFNAAAYYQNDRQTFVTRWAHLGPPPIDPSMR